jgi:hypothetical protein
MTIQYSPLESPLHAWHYRRKPGECKVNQPAWGDHELKAAVYITSRCGSRRPLTRVTLFTN